MLDRSDLGGWVTNARGGDGRAWAALYRAFRLRVYLAARGQGLEPTDAEDIVQLVLGVRLREKLEGLREYRDPASFTRWIERLAVREAQSMRRRRRRRAVLLREASAEDLLRPPSRPTDPPPTSWRDLDLEPVLRRALEGLSETLRETLLLRAVEGLTYAEIADRQGVSVETVRLRR